jgi:hypothetical protein
MNPRPYSLGLRLLPRSVARSKKVYLEWLEATIIYPPEERGTSVYVRSTFLTSSPPCYFVTLLPGACPA